MGLLQKGEHELCPAGTTTTVVEIVPVAGKVLSATAYIEPLNSTVVLKTDGNSRATVGGITDGSKVTNRGPATINVTYR